MNYGCVISGTTEDARRVVRSLLAGPVIVVGPPGVGKSAFVRMVANITFAGLPEEKRGEIFSVPAPQIGITDLSLPHVADGKHTIVINEDISKLLHLAEGNRMCILIIEDLNWADPLMRPALLGITDTTSPQIMFFVRPTHLRIICTANTPQSYDPGNALIAPQVSRAAMYHLLPQPEQFAVSFADYWGNPYGLPAGAVREYVDVEALRKWREVIASFILFHNRADYVFTDKPPVDGKPYPSPRGWDNIAVSLSINAGGEAIYPSQAVKRGDELKRVVESVLSADVASAFVAYVMAIGKIADIRDFLNNPNLVQQYLGDQMALAAIAWAASGFMSSLCKRRGELAKYISGWAGLMSRLSAISTALGYSSSVWLLQAVRTEEGRKVLEQKVDGSKTIASLVPPEIIRHIQEVVAAGKKI